jgi:hypothetical protein
VRRRLRRLLVTGDRLVDPRRGGADPDSALVPPRPREVRRRDDRIGADEKEVPPVVGNGLDLEGEKEEERGQRRLTRAG